MNIVVPVKLVPDLVEELAIADSGTALDTEWLRLILNEFDDHAIEQAILLKEQQGGQVTVIAPDVEEVDNVLFAAAAKGADRLLKLTGDFGEDVNNHALARALAAAIADLRPDLVLTGVQTHNDLDGAVGPLLAALLEMPYVGYIAGVSVSDDKATVRKEYPGGLIAEMEVSLPAVLGIQASTEPPRYVAFTKIRQAMKTTDLVERPVSGVDATFGPYINRIYQPESSHKAEMIDGDPETVAEKLVQILVNSGVV